MPRPSAQISPAHPLIREYQRSLGALREQGVENELGLRRPFENLLADSARLHGWRFVAGVGRQGRRPPHTARRHGLRRQQPAARHWESKDSHDDLDREIDRKIRRGYPSAIRFSKTPAAPSSTQDRNPVMQADLSNARDLADLLFRFYSTPNPRFANSSRPSRSLASAFPTWRAAWRIRSRRRTSTTGIPGSVRQVFRALPGFAQPQSLARGRG